MTRGTLFGELAQLCASLEATAKRNEKKRLIGAFLQRLALDEVRPAVAFITGNPFPQADGRVLEVGGRTLWRLASDRRQTTLLRQPLSITQVMRSFADIAAVSGQGSRRKKEALVRSLLNQASPLEARYLLRILSGEMRIGAVDGVVLEGIADATRIPLRRLRRGYLLLGNLGAVARIALAEGRSGVDAITLRLFTPVRPMLAQMATDVPAVLAARGEEMAFEYKFDGVRIQIHRRDDRMRIYSRRLKDVTPSLPDIVAHVQRHVHAEDVLVEGEAVATDAAGKPLRFQDLMRRFRRVHRVPEMVERIPLQLHLFDVLALDGASLIDTPYQERRATLEAICDADVLAARIVTADAKEAEQFLVASLRAGHEGLMAKTLTSTYSPGVRGKRWFKIKPYETLDLVIVAADWGYGRRTGWLSNYHLAARDAATGAFRVLGKTFKGLTDAEFTTMTRRLKALKVSETASTVHVRPALVVEVAFNEIQQSPHYPSGYALRFARITRIRDDKGPADADAMDRVETLYARQFEAKGQLPTGTER
jgi:DNA ligase-1